MTLSILGFLSCCSCHIFCWLWPYGVYNFITDIDWIVNKIFQVFAIFTSTCTWTPNIIFIAHIMFSWAFALKSTYVVDPPLIWITFSSIKFTFISALYMSCWCFSFIYFCYHNKKFKFRSSVLFSAHILPDGSSIVLELSLHLSNLTII